MKPVTDPTPAARRVMRLPETTRVAGACDMTLRRWEAAGSFPRRFKLSPNSGPFGAVAHDYDEVQQWRVERLASRATEAVEA